MIAAMSRDLDKLRSQIDATDRIILATLAKRAKLERAVGAYKKQRKIKPLDRGRWAEILETRTRQGASLGLPRTLTRKLFALIHEHSVSIQRRVSAKKRR